MRKLSMSPTIQSIHHYCKDEAVGEHRESLGKTQVCLATHEVAHHLPSSILHTCLQSISNFVILINLIVIFTTFVYSLYTISLHVASPGRGIPPLLPALRFLPVTDFWEFFLIQIESLKTEVVISCTDCEAH